MIGDVDAEYNVRTVYALYTVKVSICTMHNIVHSIQWEACISDNFLHSFMTEICKPVHLVCVQFLVMEECLFSCWRWKWLPLILFVAELLFCSATKCSELNSARQYILCSIWASIVIPMRGHTNLQATDQLDVPKHRLQFYRFARAIETRFLFAFVHWRCPSSLCSWRAFDALNYWQDDFFRIVFFASCDISFLANSLFGSQRRLRWLCHWNSTEFVRYNEELIVIALYG